MSAQSDAAEMAISVNLVEIPGWFAVIGQAARVVMLNSTAGIEPIRRAATRTGSDAWDVDDLLLVAAGEWSVRLEVLVSDFEKVAFETNFQLR